MASKKERILREYVELTKKLGKYPSERQFRLMGVDKESVENHWGKFSALRKEVGELYPELEELYAPAQLSVSDLSKHRFGVVASNTKAENKDLIERVDTLDYLEKFASKVFSGKVKSAVLKTKKHSPNAITRTHHLILSDLHIGADISADETTVQSYGVKEESRRLAAVVKHAASYKSQYRASSRLIVNLIGDLIENNMHHARTGAPIAEQCCRAIHLLSQALAYLASAYPEVVVNCSTGNHDRNKSVHYQRAVHQKWDSFATIISYALKAACSNIKNISFNIPISPIGSYTIDGMRYGYTHGDTVIKTGNPYKSVNIKQLTDQVNSINAALKDNEEYKVIMYGHVHLAHIVNLPNGCTLIGNGSLPPPDPFAVSIGSFESNTGQYIFESVKGKAVGDIRLIRCGKENDDDESLDTIIKPWESL